MKATRLLALPVVAFALLTGCGSDPAPTPADAGTAPAGAGTPDQGGSDQLPADPSGGPIQADACAVLLRAAGKPAVEAALGDPIVESDNLMGTCSMTTKEYTINTAGSTSTGRLTFGISPTALSGSAPSDKPVDGLADSTQGPNAVIWHRGNYWFSLQVLPVQKKDTDPDVIAPDVLTALAKAVDAKA